MCTVPIPHTKTLKQEIERTNAVCVNSPASEILVFIINANMIQDIY